MLELKNVCKTFNPGTSTEVTALCGVELTIDEGSWVIVIGTNGSGKSTLLNAVAGSIPVDAGTIHLRSERRQASSRSASGIGAQCLSSKMFARRSILERRMK